MDETERAARPGDASLTLEEPVEWDVGDEVVVTSTSYDPALAERRTVTGVDGDTVYLNESLEFRHYGEMQYFGSDDQYTLDERAEVMHLSRNVVIQGEDGSSADNFGGHVTVMNEHYREQHERAADGEEYVDLWNEMSNDPSLVPEVDGVEFRRMGQEGILGRYPFHWHKYGNASGSYVRNASIHDSFQRCITLHGTQHVELEGNVAYDAVGHCYFMEDGTEWDNVLRDNIGALVRSFSTEERRLIESDRAPSVYWWSNSNNDFVRNVAAGAYGSGFWLDPKPHPTGETATESISLQDPNRADPLRFGRYEDNVAHSTTDVYVQAGVGVPDGRSGGIGFFVGERNGDARTRNFYCGIGTKSFASPDERFRRKCNVTGLTAYYNSNFGVKLNNDGSLLALLNSTLADNYQDYHSDISMEEGITFVGASRNVGNPGLAGQGSIAWDIPGSRQTSVEDVHYFENRTGRSIPPHYGLSFKRESGEKLELGGLTWKYDGGFTRNNVFVNYHDTEYVDRGAVFIPDNAHQMLMWNSTLINSDPYRAWNGSHKQWIERTFIRDYDGSLTGTGEYTEIREWNPNSDDPNPELYFDDSCEDTGDPYVKYCHSRTVRIGGFNLEGAGEYNLTRVSDGVVATDGAGHFPENTTYRVGVPEGEYNLTVHPTQTDDRSWISYVIPSARPLDPDRTGGYKYKRDDIAVVGSEAALNGSDALITLYYNHEADEQHVRVRGKSDIDDGWRYSRYNKPFNHYKLEIAPTPSMPERWTFEAGGRLQHSTPAVGPDHVYVGGLDETIAALYRGNGSVAWSFDRAGSLSDSSPAFDSGTVYVGSGGGEFYALNASTGTVEWTVSTDSAIVSSPRVHGDRVYVGSNDGTVLAVNASSGSVEWTTDAGAPVLSKPAVGAGSVYVTADDGRVIALATANGTQRWALDTGAGLGHSSPTVADGVVYVAGDDLYAVNANGSVRWRAAGLLAGSTPSVAGGTVYVGAENGSVVALSADTGSVEWTYATGGAVRASPTVAGDRVVVPSTGGSVHLLAASTGELERIASLGSPGRSSAAVGGDTVYVGTRNGRVAALASPGLSAPVGSAGDPEDGPPEAPTEPVPGPEPPGNVTSTPDPVEPPRTPGNDTPTPGPADPPGPAAGDRTPPKASTSNESATDGSALIGP